MFSTNPETEIEVDALAKALVAVPIRETISYAALSEVVGYDVQRKPFALFKARKRVESDTGLRLATVKGEGIKKLDAEAIAGIGAAARKNIARKAARQAQRLTGLRYNDIDATTQARIDAERSLLGAISAMSKTDIERVEEQTRTGPVVAAKVFDLMNKAA
jgi:hypothetical protein